MLERIGRECRYRRHHRNGSIFSILPPGVFYRLFTIYTHRYSYKFHISSFEWTGSVAEVRIPCCTLLLWKSAFFPVTNGGGYDQINSYLYNVTISRTLSDGKTEVMCGFYCDCVCHAPRRWGVGCWSVMVYLPHKAYSNNFYFPNFYQKL